MQNGALMLCEVLGPTFWGGDLLQEVGGVLSDRALKAQAPEEGYGLIHRPMKANLPACEVMPPQAIHLAVFTPMHVWSYAVPHESIFALPLTQRIYNVRITVALARKEQHETLAQSR